MSASDQNLGLIYGFALSLVAIIAATVDAKDASSNKAVVFEGLVANIEGEPIEGARIYMIPRAQEPQPKPIVRARTNAAGRFEFRSNEVMLTDRNGVRSQQGSVVIATADGYGRNWVHLRGEDRQRGRAPDATSKLMIRLAKSTVALHGRFLSARGEPLVGGTVAIRSIHIPKNHDLEAFLKREQAASPYTSSGGYEASSGNADSIPELTLAAKTDDDGRFEFKGIGDGQIVRLQVTGPGVTEKHITTMTRVGDDVPVRFAGEPPNRISTQTYFAPGFTQRLSQDRTISGVVRDRESGKPVAGMRVGVSVDTMLFNTRNSYVVSDAKGRFTIGGLFPKKKGKEIVYAVSPPGLTWQTARVADPGDGEALLETSPGIPFRITVRDETGELIDAEVASLCISPNPHAGRWRAEQRTPPAVRLSHGVYEGFVLPGPFAITVKVRGRRFRPAYVNPKAFFAPARNDWSSQEKLTTYGNEDWLSTGDAIWYQDDFAAIQLVNAKPGAAALKFEATAYTDVIRKISVIDSDGEPVVGLETRGVTLKKYDHEPLADKSTFTVGGNHPERTRTIWFFQNERKLVGKVEFKGDSSEPITVHMQPWATATGRIVDAAGNPIANAAVAVVHAVKDTHKHGADTDARGVYTIEKLVPGEPYTANLYPKLGRFRGHPFQKAIFMRGEERKLGDFQAVEPKPL